MNPYRLIDQLETHSLSMSDTYNIPLAVAKEASFRAAALVIEEQDMAQKEIFQMIATRRANLKFEQ